MHNRPRSNSNPSTPTHGGMDPVESILNRANNYCSREKIKHYICNAMERPSLYEIFINLAVTLNQPQKTSFPQLRQLTQKSQKNE